MRFVKLGGRYINPERVSCVEDMMTLDEPDMTKIHFDGNYIIVAVPVKEVIAKLIGD